MGRQHASQKRFSFLGKAAGREFEAPESTCVYLTEDGNLASRLGWEGCQGGQWKLAFPCGDRLERAFCEEAADNEGGYRVKRWKLL